MRSISKKNFFVSRNALFETRWNLFFVIPLRQPILHAGKRAASLPKLFSELVEEGLDGVNRQPSKGLKLNRQPSKKVILTLNRSKMQTVKKF